MLHYLLVGLAFATGWGGVTIHQALHQFYNSIQF